MCLGAAERAAPRGAAGGCQWGAIATCPFCQRGALRVITAITQEAVLNRMLRHVKLAAVLHPPSRLPIPAKQSSTGWQKTPAASGPPVSWAVRPAAHHAVRGLVGGVRAAAVCPHEACQSEIMDGEETTDCFPGPSRKHQHRVRIEFARRHHCRKATEVRIEMCRDYVHSFKIYALRSAPPNRKLIATK